MHTTASAPAKLILFGEHAVVYDKLAIASSLNLRAYCTVVSSPAILKKQEISVKGPDVGIFSFRQDAELLKEIGKQEEKDWERMLGKWIERQGFHETAQKSLVCVCWMILTAWKLQPLYSNSSMFITLETELPVGAGLGSSASFAASLAASILVNSGYLKADSDGKTNLEIVNQYAFQIEKLIHGNPSGIDNTVSVYGGILTKQGKNIENLTIPNQVRVVLVNTKVSRNTGKLVAGVRERYEDPSTQGVISQALEDIDNCSRESLDCLCQDILDPVKLESLIDKNQKLLNVIGVGHESLDRIVSIAQEHGFHAKLTGAGGGGCAFIFVPNHCQFSANLVRLKETLSKNEFWFKETVVGGKGLVVSHHSLDDSFGALVLLTHPLRILMESLITSDLQTLTESYRQIVETEGHSGLLRGIIHSWAFEMLHERFLRRLYHTYVVQQFSNRTLRWLVIPIQDIITFPIYKTVHGKICGTDFNVGSDPYRGLSAWIAYLYGTQFLSTLGTFFQISLITDIPKAAMFSVLLRHIHTKKEIREIVPEVYKKEGPFGFYKHMLSSHITVWISHGVSRMFSRITSPFRKKN